MKKQILPSLALISVLILAACSEAPKTATSQPDAAATPEAPAAPTAAKAAYWQMYEAAHKWAPDSMPVSVEAKEIPGYKNEDGKAAMWNAKFASLNQKEARVFTYAIAVHPPDIYKGVTIGKSEPWTGSRDLVPFSMAQVSVDSEAAVKAATADAGSWLKQHPQTMPPDVQLKELARYQIPTWIVTWGNEKLGYRSFVSGVDGKPIHK